MVSRFNFAILTNEYGALSHCAGLLALSSHRSRDSEHGYHIYYCRFFKENKIEYVIMTIIGT